MTVWILAALVVIGVIVAAVYGIKRLAEARRRRIQLNALESVKEVAWQHRDLAPEFSTIIIDEINQKQKEIR